MAVLPCSRSWDYFWWDILKEKIIIPLFPIRNRFFFVNKIKKTKTENRLEQDTENITSSSMVRTSVYREWCLHLKRNNTRNKTLKSPNKKPEQTSSIFHWTIKNPTLAIFLKTYFSNFMTLHFPHEFKNSFYWSNSLTLFSRIKLYYFSLDFSLKPPLFSSSFLSHQPNSSQAN